MNRSLQGNHTITQSSKLPDKRGEEFAIATANFLNEHPDKSFSASELFPHLEGRFDSDHERKKRYTSLYQYLKRGSTRKNPLWRSTVKSTPGLIRFYSIHSMKIDITPSSSSKRKSFDQVSNCVKKSKDTIVYESPNNIDLKVFDIIPVDDDPSNPNLTECQKFDQFWTNDEVTDMMIDQSTTFPSDQC
jgi:hypothetical protein